MTKGVVLCLGNADKLVAFLLKYSTIIDPEASAAQRLPELDVCAAIDNDCPTRAFREYYLRLDTKYYLAELKIWLANSSKPFEDVVSTIGVAMSRVEGVILVFDPACPGEFENAIRWADAVSDGAQLQLLVALGDAGAEERPRYIEWGIDHSYEFVESARCTVEAVRAASLDREKEGVPRVMEAIEATAWSTMERKKHPALRCNTVVYEPASPPLPEMRPSSLALGAPQKECTADRHSTEHFLSFKQGVDVVVTGLVGKPDLNGEVGTVIRFDPDKKRYVVRLKTMMANVIAVRSVNIVECLAPEVAAVDEAASLAVKESIVAEAAVARGEQFKLVDSIEHEMGSLEELVDEIRRTRSAAATLSDDERRAGAAKAALRLLATLGEADSDHSDGE